MSSPAPAHRLSPARRIGKGVGALVILAVVGVLLVFGDSIFGADPGSDDPAPSESSPTLSEQEQSRVERAASKAGATVLRTWSRPASGYRQWWRDLKPLLSPGAQEAYAFTDPRKVPRLGELEVEETKVHGSGRNVTVYFGTDVGTFGVDLSRKQGRWMAHRVIFPERESVFG